jgi:hypothetical protein
MNLKATITLSLILSITSSHAQVKIVSDTLSIQCMAYKLKKDRYLFTSQAELEQSEFFTEYDIECLPFSDIDFGENILLGYRYRGSNCDTRIQWSTIKENDGGYLLQFHTQPNHVCRDLNLRIAWFMISKPSKVMEIAIERIY